MGPGNNKDFNEIFIIDKGIIVEFFKDSNYEKAQLFFIYLTTHCKNRKALMIPSLFDEIIGKITSRVSDDTKRTEIISYLENWISKADLLGEDKGEEKHDTHLLYRLLRLVNPECKIIILSNKYSNPEDPGINILKLEGIETYLYSNPNFKEFIEKEYGVNDGASY